MNKYVFSILTNSDPKTQVSELKKPNQSVKFSCKIVNLIFDTEFVNIKKKFNHLLKLQIRGEFRTNKFNYMVNKVKYVDAVKQQIQSNLNFTQILSGC